MSEELRLELLGGLALSRSGLPVTGFVSAKAPALLCFLALDPRPHSRESLAGLLWSESREEDARASLRVALSNLRRIVGHEYLHTSRTTVVFARNSHYWLDVEQFEIGVGQEGADPAVAAESVRQAVTLYRGELLAGVSLNGAPVFEEWLASRREHLRQMAIDALEWLAGQATTAGNGNASVGYLKRLLELDPWREDAHRQLMEALVAAGRRSEAMLHYHDCRRLLVEELGVEPEPATVRLFERIRDGDVAARVPDVDRLGQEGPSWLTTLPPAQPAQSGMPHTSFIGREQELSQIVANLANPECRLLTLVGLGGIGKSRLAHRAIADRRIGFRDGLHFVQLASVADPELLAPAIAEAIGVPLEGPDSPTRQLLRFLRDREMLLVLDNFEHLVDGAFLVNDILDAAPGIKVVVTSRERLALRSEWLIPISGLPVVTESGADTSNAVRLFVERARQINPGFELTTEHAASIARICALLRGQPLGIELAAAWTRTHSCSEIEARMASNLDFLTSPLRDIPERHRSLRAVFVQTWSLLSRREQALFQALAVFRGGFDQQAVEAVAGASRAELTSLIEKFLLFRDGSGRYALHELMRQYATEHLASSTTATRTYRRHAVYYADLLHAAEPALRGAGQQEAMRTIALEIDNIRAAWHWAIAHDELSILGRALDGMQLFVDLTGRLIEGRQVLEQAIAAVEAIPVNSDEDDLLRARDVLHGRLLGWLARHAMSLGQFTESKALLEQSLTLLERHDAGDELALGMDTRAMNANAVGNQDEALRLQRAALADAEASNDRLGMSLAFRGLGGIAFNAGNFEGAGSWFAKSLRERQDLHDWDGAGRELARLGEVARLMGDYEIARQRWEDNLALLSELGGGLRMALPLTSLGELCLDQGLLDEAEQYFTRAREIAEDTDSQRTLVLIVRGQAVARGYQGDFERAADLAEEAASMARSNGFLLGIMRCLDLRAWLAMIAADSRRARSLADEMLALATRAGNQYQAGRAEVSLGRAMIELGDLVRAEQFLDNAYSRLAVTGARPAVLDVLTSMARLHIARGDDNRTILPTQERHISYERAMELVTMVLGDPTAWFQTREHGGHLVTYLADRLAPPVLDAARVRGERRELSAITVLSRDG